MMSDLQYFIWNCCWLETIWNNKDEYCSKHSTDKHSAYWWPSLIGYQAMVARFQYDKFVLPVQEVALTHCGLVILYGDLELGQYLLK